LAARMTACTASIVSSVDVGELSPAVAEAVTGASVGDSG